MTKADLKAYQEAHSAVSEFTTVGPMIDIARTVMSRIRIYLDTHQHMTYLDGDPLYDQTNNVDAELSRLLEMMSNLGIDVSHAGQ